MLQRKISLCNWRMMLGAMLMTATLFASFEFQGIGWAAATANITVIGPPHLDRVLVNPALMRATNATQISLQYHRPFAGLDLQAGAIKTRFTIRDIPIVSGLHYFGDEYYSEMMLSAGSCWGGREGFQSGIMLNYYQLNIVDLDMRYALSLSMSLNVQLSENVRLGSALQHFAQLEKSLPIPQRFLFGAEYTSSPVHLLVAFEKEAALPLEVCIGLVSNPGRKWQLALGYRNLSQTISTGWRIRFARFRIHYTWLIHTELPDSHGFGLEWFIQ